MDFLENKFKEHRDDFDYIHPDSSSWDAIENEVFKSKASNRSITWWLKIAALFAIGLSATFLLLQSPSSEQKSVGLEEDMLFPDLALRNPDGQEIALSSLQGKVVLVDFWASYCMVCTEDHCYYFKPLYNTFKDQGFEIYSVSVDSSANNWLQVIQRDQLDWIQVSDLMGYDSPIAKEFGVNALPTNYLLDQNGKIIAKDIDAVQLEKTLSSMLAYQ